jgi:hypothetical protein
VRVAVIRSVFGKPRGQPGPLIGGQDSAGAILAQRSKTHNTHHDRRDAGDDDHPSPTSKPEHAVERENMTGNRGAQRGQTNEGYDPRHHPPSLHRRKPTRNEVQHPG